MKKFIEAINEKGITRKMVESIKFTNKMTGMNEAPVDSIKNHSEV